MKRMIAAARNWRNRQPNLDDQVMMVSAGLWNSYLDFTEKQNIKLQLVVAST